MKIKDLITKLRFLLTNQFGFDPGRTFRFLLGLPHYVRDLLQLRSHYKGRIKLMPCLHDRFEEGGAAHGEYFWQDILVAQMIFEAKPQRHVDIGSRVDGFVAHVASFRDIEVFDVRPIKTVIPRVKFKQADLMKPLNGMEGYCDSLSCLHALEHFGLGRYGDPIDPAGFERGMENMARLLKKGGVYYLSVPVGIERVEFNAHRVMGPHTILKLAEMNALRLSRFICIGTNGKIDEYGIQDRRFDELGRQRYSLGIFVFLKQN